MLIKDVFFDLDHTLWDFEKNSALAFKTILTKNGIEVEVEVFLQHYIVVNHKYWEWYRKDVITQNELRYGRLKETFDLLNYTITDEVILFLADEYITYLSEFNHLFDGALELLEYLKPKYNLHIITNGFQDVQLKKLNNANISHFFNTITNSEMAGVKKPNPIIFEHALRIANATKETSIMIGDCIDADVLGALNSGIDAILFSDAKPDNYPHIKHISHLLELKKHL